MSSKSADPQPRQSWSLTRRLVLLYTATACLILIASTALLYFGLKESLGVKRVSFLHDEINVLRAMLLEDEAEVHREIAIEFEALQFIRHYVRLLDENGTVLVETPGMSDLLPPHLFPAPTDTSVGHERKVHLPGAQGFIVASAFADTKGGEAKRVLQVAMETSRGDGILHSYRRHLIAVLLAGVLASALAAVYTTRRALLPLREINAATDRITASHLNERIGQREWPQELQHLASSFDQMLERLEDSFVRLSQCTSNLAHELRTPINNLMGEAEVLLSRERTPEEFRRAVESSLEEYSRLSRIFDSILFLARADSGVTSPARVEVSIGEDLEKIREYYHPLAEDAGIELTCTGEGIFLADRSLVRRAVANLVENALKFTSAGGRILLAAGQAGHDFEICITDSGCGIAAEHLPRLFDRFYRVDGSSTQGAGLGLAIVRSIMDLHGGTVSIESTPDIGTTVTLSFPLK